MRSQGILVTHHNVTTNYEIANQSSFNTFAADLRKPTSQGM